MDGVEKIDGKYCITYNGVTGTSKYWADICGVEQKTICKRIKDKKPIELILAKKKVVRKSFYPKKKTVKKVKKKTDSICWECKNSVPKPDRSQGCSWSISNIPVEGWKAEPRKCDKYRSFLVEQCPEFVEG